MFVCYNLTLLLTVTKTLLTLVKASQTKQIEGQNLTVLSILQQSGGPYIIHIIFYYKDIACTLPQLLQWTFCSGHTPSIGISRHIRGYKSYCSWLYSVPDTDYLHSGGGGTSPHGSTRPKASIRHEQPKTPTIPPPLADMVHPIFTLSAEGREVPRFGGGGSSFFQ